MPNESVVPGGQLAVLMDPPCARAVEAVAAKIREPANKVNFINPLI
jgi:hypothetical protein